MAVLEEIVPEETGQQRHPSLDKMCGQLEAVMHGAAAAALLADIDTVPAGAGLAVLPLWSWESPLIDVGRKDRAHHTGERLLLPVRNIWDTASVVAVGAESLAVGHRTVGMGHLRAGQSKVVQRAGAEPVNTVATVPSLATPVFVGSLTKMGLKSRLQRLIDAGEAAKWELVRGFESQVRKVINVAHAHVCHEIGQSRGVDEPLLDAQGLEQIETLMMYGEEPEAGKKKRTPSVFRLIELCQEPEAFVRVDPLKYATKHLRRDAETHIRRKLEDPHVGPKVRAIARANPKASLEEVIEQYRLVYPKDRLSTDRAAMALSTGPDAMANCRLLFADSQRFEITLAEEHYLDEALAG